MNQNTVIILALIGIGALVFLMSRQNQATAALRLVPMQYQNEERWELKRDSSGHIAEIIVHRDAKQS